MNRNNGFGLATMNNLKVCPEWYGKTGTSSKVTIFFSRIFGKDESMIDKNEFVFLFLQNEISKNNMAIINRILSDTSAIVDLKPSIIKSILIMTKNLAGVDSHARDYLAAILAGKMQK